MSENSEMTCAELADMAAELALGVLTGRERAMAVAHLDSCDACQEDVRQLMATGERLIELLPPAEPPIGFETRVLARLGLPAPPSQAPLRFRPLPRQARATRRPRRLRRRLSVAAVALAIIAAGFGGWRIGAGTAPAPSTAAGPLTTASLLSATRQSVGDVFVYSGSPRWLFMSVDLGSGDGAVTCQLVGATGQVHTLGTFQLADGYGQWGSPDPGNVGDVQGARLVSATGAVLATATFSW
jgi:hypothetical protein